MRFTIKTCNTTNAEKRIMNLAKANQDYNCTFQIDLSTKPNPVYCAR